MAEKETLSERYAGDILTDNTKIPKYEQCKDCLFRKSEINGVFYDNYRKSCCMMFPYPQMKPMEFYHGTARCEFYEKEKQKK